jgi:hypothetical protein
MTKELKLIPIATALSGAISGFTLVYHDLAVRFGPGVWFGLAVSIVMLRSGRFHAVSAIAFTIASAGSWYAALQIYLLQSDSPLQALLAAGAAGGALVSIAFIVCQRRLDLARILVGLLLGIAGAFLMYLILSAGDQDGGAELGSLSYAIAFAVWHVLVGIGLIVPLGGRAKRP